MSYMRIASGKVTSIKSGAYPAMLTGLDASKPSPGVSDVYYAMDTSKTYSCFVNGVWSLVSSPAREEYNNHMGTTDNIMSVAVSGNGTALTNPANHRMDLNTGDSLIGDAQYKHAVGINLGGTDFEINFKIQNLVDGVGGERDYAIGVVDAFWTLLGAVFYQHTAGSWLVQTTNGVTTETTNIASPVAGDILTIKGMRTLDYSDNIIQFLKNGSILATHKTVTLAGITAYAGAAVECTAATSTARQLSIDHIGWKVFK